MNLKKIAVFMFTFALVLISAQNVFLTKVEKTNENSDKFFVMIDSQNTKAEYLGEIDVQGFSNNDREIYLKIYDKAKEIGANAFAYHPFETLDGKGQPFNPANYKVRLFFITKEEFSRPSDLIYLFSSSAKSQTISVNKEDYILPPRSFTKLKAASGEIFTISTKKFLGSSIKISGQAESPAQYFQVSSVKVRSNTFGEPGINLKLGDIIALDRSYGDFLRMIYMENK